MKFRMYSGRDTFDLMGVNIIFIDSDKKFSLPSRQKATLGQAPLAFVTDVKSPLATYFDTLDWDCWRHFLTLSGLAPSPLASYFDAPGRDSWHHYLMLSGLASSPLASLLDGLGRDSWRHGLTLWAGCVFNTCGTRM